MNIVLVSEKLDPLVTSLALSLRAQQNEVTLITSESEHQFIHEQIDVLRYFKKWSILEVMQLIPVLMQKHAQIFHFFQPQKILKGWNPAFYVLAMLCKSMPGGRLVFSSFENNPQYRRTRLLESMLKISDASISHEYKDWNWIENQSEQKTALSERKLSTLSKYKHFAWIPYSLDSFSEKSLLNVLENVLNKNTDLNVLAHSWGKMNVQQRQNLLEQLAAQNLENRFAVLGSDFEGDEYQQQCEYYLVPVIKALGITYNEDALSNEVLRLYHRIR